MRKPRSTGEEHYGGNKPIPFILREVLFGSHLVPHQDENKTRTTL